MEDDTAFQSHEPATIQAQTAAADRMFVPEGEPFLNFHQNSGMSDEDETQLSLEDHSTLYCSLVALVKAQYPFDERLEDKAAWFLRYLPKRMDEMDLKLFLFTDLVPSSDGPCSGFVESILTLLSSRHSNVVEATVSFLFQSLDAASLDNQYQIMGTDFVAKVLAALQPDTQPLSGNEGIIQNLVEILPIVALLTLPDTLMELNITTAVDIFNHREMIFQKVVLPSSQFLTFLLTNRHDLNRDLANSFTYLLRSLIRIGPFHRPTLEFVLASPIVMAFTNYLSLIENHHELLNTFYDIGFSLEEWTEEDAEVEQSAKRMIQALFSEGLEDTLEQILLHDKGRDANHGVVDECHSISRRLGSNVKRC